MHDSDQQSVIEELIFNICEKNAGQKISKNQIMIILYNLRTNISKGNKISNMLAFYWYKDGPYSEPIAHIIDSMASKKLIQITDKPDMMIRCLPSNHARLIKPDNGLKQVMPLIMKQIDNFKNKKGVIYPMCGKNAPYALYYSYKNSFMGKFKIFYEYLSNSQDITEIRFKPADIDDALVQVTLDIPRDEHFRNFRRSLNLYSQGLFAILSHKLPYDQNILNLLKKASDLHKMIWDVFVSGVRVQHHDAYYENKIKEWSKDFEDKSSILRSQIDEFHLMVFKKIKDVTHLPIDLDYPNKPMHNINECTPNEALKRIDEIVG